MVLRLATGRVGDTCGIANHQPGVTIPGTTFNRKVTAMLSIDAMRYATLHKCIEYLVADQGDLEMPKDLYIDVEHDDLELAISYLCGLEDTELEVFCIGDVDLDMQHMIDSALDREAAEAAHRVLDSLFMKIGG
jgi:hypothetical protein